MSGNTRKFLRGSKGVERAVERTYTFFLCRNCRLRFQVVDPKEAARLFSDVQDVAPRVRQPSRAELRADADAVACLQRMTGGRRLLDVGSGDGRFLQAACKAGLSCVGTDVSVRLAERARERSRADVRVGELAQLRLPVGSFDIVNLDGVLMYVATPRDLLLEVARLLRHDGVCRIHEINPDGLIGRLKGKRYWFYAPTHVNAWTARSVALLAARAGLSVCRTIAGTEASLKAWRATRPRAGRVLRLFDTWRFLLRKVRLFGLTLGGDSVYYLRKSPAVEPAATGAMVVANCPS
jgi:SAM-dependent methyltransferase